MAQDSAPNATPSTPVGTADVANASALVESVSVIRQALSTGSDAIVTAITAIATAVTQKLIGGVVGTTTNRLLKAKTVSSGSSAGSLQASGITCDSSDNLTAVGSVAVVTGGALKTATSAGNTALLQAYDVDGAAYTTFATLTANNTPTMDLSAAVTSNGSAIITAADAASQAQQETGTSTVTFVSPGRQQFHPSACKCWGEANSAGSVLASYNVTSISDDTTGTVTWTIATDFSSTSYGKLAAVNTASGAAVIMNNGAAGSIRTQAFNPSTFALFDPDSTSIALFGDQ
jgi:hypothetical protein